MGRGARAGGVLTLLAAMVVTVLPGSAAAQEDPPYVAWNPLLPSLATPFHPSRERDCSDGTPDCIEQTLGDMYDRFDRLYVSCDHNAAFALTYIRVTEAIRLALLAGFYEEPAFLHHEDRVFARLYFDSYDAWAAGRRQDVSPAWREAYDAGRDRNVNGIGNLLMSMNAHINRDFPFLLDALGLTMPDGRSRKPDHDRGNEILNTLYDDVLRELSERFDPVVDDANVPGLTADDATVFQILQAWREDVWRNAERLAAADTLEQRALVAEYIEQYALANARQIRAATTIEDSSARDAHCAAYKATHRETGAMARPVSVKLRMRTVNAPRAARGATTRASGAARRARRRVVRAGVRVRVSCPGPLRFCEPTLRVVRRRKAMTRTRTVELAPGQSRVLWMPPTARGRKVLARRRPRPTVLVVARSPSPWGTVREATIRRRLQRP